MKRLFSLLLAVAATLSLAACGGNQNKLIETKGIFVLDADERINLSKDEDLKPQETYLIHIYDIIPDSAKNDELSSFNSSYTATLNGVNKYDSINIYRSGSTYEFYTPVNTFAIASRYISPNDYSNKVTVFGGGENPYRAISIFRINKNDVKDDMTVTLSITGSDLHNYKKEYHKDDIKVIHFFDEAFEVEDNPYQYWLASTIYTRADFIGSYMSASIEKMKHLFASSVATDISISCSLNGWMDYIQYKYGVADLSNEDYQLDSSELMDAVNAIYPELSDTYQSLANDWTKWLTTSFQISPDYFDRNEQRIREAAKTITDFFEQQPT